MLKGKDVLLYFSMKYKGNWDNIYNAIKTKEKIPNNYDFDLLKKEVNSNYLTMLDDNYPTFLKHIRKPPFVLYYHGDLSLISNYNQNLSVIGKRNCSEYGKNVTKKLINNLTNKNMKIVSGFAHGIDTFSHKYAIENNLKTVAILPSGINNCYPKDNYNLYEKIKEIGLLISEYPNNTEIIKENFYDRNRLIASFSSSLLVIEASKRSGSQITVNHAIECSRNILAVPTSILEESYCNEIIKDGAYLISNSSDIEIHYKNNF